MNRHIYDTVYAVVFLPIEIVEDRQTKKSYTYAHPCTMQQLDFSSHSITNRFPGVDLTSAHATLLGNEEPTLTSLLARYFLRGIMHTIVFHKMKALYGRPHVD